MKTARDRAIEKAAKEAAEEIWTLCDDAVESCEHCLSYVPMRVTLTAVIRRAMEDLLDNMEAER